MPKNAFFTLSSGVCWLLWLSARCCARERMEIQRQSSGLSRNWYSVKVPPRGLIREPRADVSEERLRRERLGSLPFSSFYVASLPFLSARTANQARAIITHDTPSDFHEAFFFNDRLDSIVLTFASSRELTKVARHSSDVSILIPCGASCADVDQLIRLRLSPESCHASNLKRRLGLFARTEFYNKNLLENFVTEGRIPP